jgi:hypothetical protein
VPPSRRPGLWQPLSKLEISRHHLRPHQPLSGTEGEPGVSYHPS